MADLNAAQLVDQTLEVLGSLADKRDSVDRVMRVRVAYDGTDLSLKDAITELGDTMKLTVETLGTDCKTLKEAVTGGRVELAGYASEATGRQIDPENVGQLRAVYNDEVQEQSQRETMTADVLARAAKFCADTGTVNPDPGVLAEAKLTAKKPSALAGLFGQVTSTAGSALRNNPFISLEMQATKQQAPAKKPTWTAEPILKDDDPNLRAFSSFEKRVAGRKIEGKLVEQLDALKLGEARRGEILTALTKLARQQEADCKRIKTDILIDFQNFETIQNMLDAVEAHVNYVLNFFFPKSKTK